jgi:hypothetical protein
MATGLKSVIKNLKSPLALKAFGFGALIFTARFLLSGGWAGALIFSLGAFMIYFNPPFRSTRLFASFLTLVAVSGLVIIHSSLSVLLLSVLLLSFLFYLILAVKDLALLNRDWWYFVLHLSLTYISLMTFFFWYSDFPVSGSIFLALVVFLLWNERFPGMPVVSGLISFLLLQVAWAFGLLPLGFIGAAISVLLVAFFFGDLVYFINKEGLSPRLILVDTTAVTIGLVATFFITHWVP